MSDKVVDHPTRRRLLTKQETAEVLGVCVKTLKKMTDVGEIRAVVFRGRRGYLIEEVDRFLKSLPDWKSRH